MDAGVIAKNVVGNLLGHAGQQLEVEPRLQLRKKALRSPAFFHEQILQPGAIAALAQSLLVAEDLRHRSATRTAWCGSTKASRRTREMRLIRKAPANAQRVANFVLVLHRREANIVNLRMTAP